MKWSAAVISSAAAAAAALILPTPAEWVEHWYSRRWFPVEQHLFTAAGNLIPFALFDLLCLAAVIAAAIGTFRACQLRPRGRAVRRLGGNAVLAVSVVYLVFLATWGLNYRRIPLKEKLAYDPARVTAAAAQQLSVRTILALNALYADAHAGVLSDETLASVFHHAQGVLRDPAPIVPGRPKFTILGGYFHAASIAGMTDPFLLETMLAPDLLDVERPFVTLHEWAHLAGYADESEANFVAWVACMEGPPAAQYSAWFALLGDVQAYLPKQGGPRLAIGPRIDVFAARYRYQQTSPAARAVARESYDRYLRANRVASGIDSYALVVQLILGTGVDSAGRPSLR